MPKVTPLLNYVIECLECGEHKFYVSVDGFKGKITQIYGFECCNCEKLIPIFYEVEESDEQPGKQKKKKRKSPVGKGPKNPGKKV